MLKESLSGDQMFRDGIIRVSGMAVELGTVFGAGHAAKPMAVRRPVVRLEVS